MHNISRSGRSFAPPSFQSHPDRGGSSSAAQNSYLFSDNNRLYDPNEPPPPSYESVIANDGSVQHQQGIRRTATGDNIQGFPVASTVEAADAYRAIFSTDDRFLTPGDSENRSSDITTPDSITRFFEDKNFSAEQKMGIQSFYRKHTMAIGMAHQLLALKGNRFEFIFDNHPQTTPEEFSIMRKEALKRVELLQYIPGQGISIRMADNVNHAKVFYPDEMKDLDLLEEVDRYLSQQSISRKSVPSLQIQLENSISDATNGEIKTSIYAFSSRKINTVGCNHQERLEAKNLTKAMVNRPADLTPISFFKDIDKEFHPGKDTSSQAIENIDTAAKNVGVLSAFSVEKESVINGQSEYFPYSEGCHIQASLLASERFWDSVDEGAIFSKQEIQSYLGTPVTEQDYRNYFEKALDRQARMFNEEETQVKKATNPHLLSQPKKIMEYVRTVQGLEMEAAEHLQQMLQEFRQHPAWTQKVEEGINRFCQEKDLPIGMGMFLIDLADRDIEFNLDNSGSMLRDSDDQSVGYKSTRLDEATNQIKALVEILSYIPGRTLTLTTLNDINGPTQTAVTFDTSSHNFRKDVDKWLKSVRALGSTPLNNAYAGISTRTAAREQNGKNSTCVLFSDGGPTDKDKTLALHRVPHRTLAQRPGIVQSESVRSMMYSMVNRRDPERTAITIRQCSNVAAEIAWTNMADAICQSLNAIDDFDAEEEKVLSRHGASFPFNRAMYDISLLLPNNKLLDSLNEEGIFSKIELEKVTGKEMTNAEYDQYFDQAYAAQYDKDSENIQCQSIAEFSPVAWALKTDKASHWTSPAAAPGLLTTGRFRGRVAGSANDSSSSAMLTPDAQRPHREDKKRFSFREALGIRKKK